MKKMLAIILTMCFSMGIAACAEGETSSTKDSQSKMESGVSAIELPEDKFD